MADSPAIEKSRTRLARFLDVIERVGNRLPDPVTIFILLGVAALLGSWLAARFGVSVEHPVTHQKISAVNLLNADGLRRMLTQLVPNFVGFAPLGTVLVVMVGVGIAERVGLFAALLKAIVTAVPAWAVTPTVIFAAFMSHSAADAGYLVLTPLAAMLYASLGRNPIAGIAAAFSGIGGGFSANLLISALDPMLAGLTQQAAQLYDGSYVVRATANWYFMAASVIVLTAVATWVSVRIVEPRLGPWQPADAQPRPATEPLKPLERSGLAAALVSFAACIALICVLVVPKDAPLRDPANPSDLSPFYNSLVALLTLVFFVPGLTYGLWTRAIRSDRQASGMMSDTMATMGAYIVMAFFASQAIAYFQWSQLGMIIAMEGASLLRAAHFTGVPLFITFIIITASINILIASASAKWTMIAPVFVPMFMALGYSPEMTQALYRVGDSVTNVITPLNYYLPSIIIPIAQRYVPKAGIGTIIAAMLPYSIAFFIVWGGMIVIWLSLGLPIGPDAPLQYVPPQ